MDGIHIAILDLDTVFTIIIGCIIDGIESGIESGIIIENGMMIYLEKILIMDIDVQH